MKIIMPLFVTLLLTGILAHAQSIAPNRYNVVGAVQTGPGAEGGAVGTIEVFKNKTATLKFFLPSQRMNVVMSGKLLGPKFNTFQFLGNGFPKITGKVIKSTKDMAFVSFTYKQPNHRSSSIGRASLTKK
jgi:hypothetical protein